MSPIQRLIALNPVSAVVETAESSGGYDPSLTTDYATDLRNLWPVIGAMSGVKLEGDTYDATFTIDAADRVDEIAVGARIQFATSEYGIAVIRPRYRFGQVSGFTLGLSI